MRSRVRKIKESGRSYVRRASRAATAVVFFSAKSRSAAAIERTPGRKDGSHSPLGLPATPVWM